MVEAGEEHSGQRKECVPRCSNVTSPQGKHVPKDPKE